MVWRGSSNDGAVGSFFVCVTGFRNGFHARTNIVGFLTGVFIMFNDFDCLVVENWFLIVCVYV